MIRINLLKNLGSVAQSAPARGLGGFNSTSPSDSATQAKELAKVFLLLSSGSLLLAGYGYYVKEQRQAEYEVKSREITAIDEQIKNLEKDSPKIDKYGPQKKVLEKKMDVLKQLGQGRLVEVKTLDILQSIIPPRTWLKDISIKDGQVVLSGSSESSEAALSFLKLIGENPYFSEVADPTFNSDDAQGNTLKKFSVSFRAGKRFR